jgi:hypothetical protein
VPLAARRAGDLPPVQLRRRLVRRHVGKLGEDRPHAPGEGVGFLLAALTARGPAAELPAALFGNREALLRPLADELPLLLRQRGEQVQDERVNVGAKLGDAFRCRTLTTTRLTSGVKSSGGALTFRQFSRLDQSANWLNGIATVRSSNRSRNRRNQATASTSEDSARLKRGVCCVFGILRRPVFWPLVMQPGQLVSCLMLPLTLPRGLDCRNSVVQLFDFAGALGEIRTHDPQIRSLVLHSA